MRHALITLLLAATASVYAAPPAKQMEALSRGVVALPMEAGVFVSWRLLGTDAPGTLFNLYRGGQKLNAEPQALTSYVDAKGAADSAYTVSAVVAGVEQTRSVAAPVWGAPFKTVPVSKPADGVTPDGVAYSYQINDGAAADLDGDGEYELIVKWQPTNAKDNSQKGYTGNTYLDAYRLRTGSAAPVLDGFTGEQRVSLGWAQLWRVKFTERSLRKVLASMNTRRVSPRQRRHAQSWTVVQGVWRRRPRRTLRPTSERAQVWAD